MYSDCLEVNGLCWRLKVYPVSAMRSEKHQSYSKSASGFLPCSRQAGIRMRSDRLLRLDDNKSVAKCWPT